MASHLSALKRARQTEKRTVTNRVNASRLKTAIRGFRQVLASGDKKAAEASYRKTISAIDKSVQKGVIHHNTAARYKSRLTARLRAMP
ncbi:MAG: 30S ribosomal protein S20 [Terriglobales bacterium]